MALHPALAKLRIFAQRHPVLALLSLGGLGAALYYGSDLVAGTPAPVPRTKPAQAQTVPGLGAERSNLEKQLLTLQQQLATTQQERKEEQQVLRQLQQQLTQGQRDEEQKRQAFTKQMEGVVTTAQQQIAQAIQAATRQADQQRKSVTPTGGSTARTPARPAPTLPVQAGAPPTPKAVILQHAPGQASEPRPPLPLSPETPQLAAGCFARMRVITGVMATPVGGQDWWQRGLPVLMSVTDAFACPHQLQGPGRAPLPTSVPLQGCFAFGRTKADLSASRAIIALDTLSCVFPSGASFEQPIKGYVTDADGTLGLVGTVETHDSAKIAKVFLTALAQEASSAFGLARASVIVAPTSGGGQQPFQGTQTLLQQIGSFWLEQAKNLLPTLWVPSTTPGWVVLQEGLPLEDFPTYVTLTGGR